MSKANYLAEQNGAEEVGFVDLLTGRQNHFHLLMVEHGAGMVEVHSTQLLYTREIIEKLRKKFKKKNCMLLILFYNGELYMRVLRDD